MQIHTVPSAGGVNLHVREWGKPTGTPILFVHGWSQSFLAWFKQYESALANEFRLVAFDLRGHGMSDQPQDPSQYNDSEKWAADIAAIVERLELERPTLVGWSYGGVILADYLRRYGQTKIGGINFVDSGMIIGSRGVPGPGIAKYAADAFGSDLPREIAAIRGFLHACFAQPIAQDEFETMIAFSMKTTPLVRRAMTQRELDIGPIVAEVTLPVLVTHGRLDTVCLPVCAEYILAHCRTAEASWYDGVAHAPFFEAPARFNRELAAFARKVRG